MTLALRSPISKLLPTGLLLCATALYTAVAASEYLAYCFASRTDRVSLSRAIRLQPENAEYRYQLGRYYALTQQWGDAVNAFTAAVGLNPHKANYWFALAGANQVLDLSKNRQDALEHAVLVDPHTPEVAWQAANLYLAEGEVDKSLQQFRTVIDGDPSLSIAALRLAWQVQPDVEVLLREAVPSTIPAYATFLEILISGQQTDAAEKVWDRLKELHQPVDRALLFDYIRYLIMKKEVVQADKAWRDAAELSKLQNYQPYPQNLVVNGDFSLEMLNGGFDWVYAKRSDVTLALDPTEQHNGSRSLMISYDSRGLEDTGIRQAIAVEPDTLYEFSAYFKSDNMDGAGGPLFLLQDLYAGTPYFTSDYLKDSDVWKQVSGTFKTGQETNLLLLRIQRSPVDKPIRGKLWIDGVRLRTLPEATQ